MRPHTSPPNIVAYCLTPPFCYGIVTLPKQIGVNIVPSINHPGLTIVVLNAAFHLIPSS